MNQQNASRRKQSRAGISARSLILVLVVLGVVAGAFITKVVIGSLSSQASKPKMVKVRRGAFAHVIVERGTMESSQNTDVKCFVKATKGLGTAIKELKVKEGDLVVEGQELAILETAPLEESEKQQQIVCNSSEASVVKAKSVLETAIIAKQEYEEGTFKEEEGRILLEILVAQEDFERSLDVADHSAELFKKGYISSAQLKADQFAIEQATEKWILAELNLSVLRNFKKKKQIIQLDADIDIANAAFKSEDNSHQIDKDRLAEIVEQKKFCVIKAPESGQVIFANRADHRGNNEVVIEEGTVIRENQVVFRLPDPSQMQVNAKINESKIGLLEVGQKAVVEFEATRVKVDGVVINVNQYAEPSSFWTGDVKEYETLIKIDSAGIMKIPEDQRPRAGMTAQVHIHVEHVDNVLQVPVTAVLEHGSKHYCVIWENDQVAKRLVTIRSANDTDVVIASGLEEDEEVVRNAEAHRDKLGLPELDEEEAKAGSGTQGKPGEKKSEKGSAREGPGGGPGGGGGRPDPAMIAGMVFSKLDTNSDGRLDKEEQSKASDPRLAEADTNGDGAIDKAELTASIKKRFGSGGGGPGSGGQGRGPGGGG